MIFYSMRKLKKPKIGQYVLVARWGDKSYYDPWRIGYIDSILIKEKETLVTVKDCNRLWPHCWTITPDEATERFNTSELIEGPMES